MAEFFTRKGDDGTTGFLGEGRLDKDDIRMETLGTLDECSAQCGVIRAKIRSASEREMIAQIQRDLYHIMAETAADKLNAAKFRVIDDSHVKWLEGQIERMANQVKMPSGFILPGENELSAQVSVTRTIVRRAERRMATMRKQELLENPALIMYLNRLSSLMFVLEIFTVQKQGEAVIPAKGKA
jgi:cob(I)alamin adenosyltransferase